MVKLMSIRVRCQYCDSICGVRQEITFRMLKGATVEIVATCPKCNRAEAKTDDNVGFEHLLRQFGINDKSQQKGDK